MKQLLVLVVGSLVLAACGALSAPALPTSIAGSAIPHGGTTPFPPTPASTTSTAPSSGPAAFPNPNNYRWAPVAAGLVEPTDIQLPDDGSGRMFVLEQPGRIRIVHEGQLTPVPFLDISSEVGSAGSEQGLLGLAFHPDFKQNPFFYVNYTDINGNTVIARFQAAGDRADPASEKQLLHIDQPFPNHNGGAVVFGPDGYLYLGLGDGGSAGDPLGNGQNTSVLLAKLLRIEVDHGDPYAIPPGNPFASSGGRPEIWAYGLRNPWRISFDRGNGDLYIADVGQDTWEEVDFVPAGSSGGGDFGWNYREGKHRYSLANLPAGLKLIEPVAEYNHTEGNCSVTGGYVYRGSMPEWQGIYIYGDYCSGDIWGLQRSAAAGSNSIWVSQPLFQSGAHITTFGQDPSGEVYFADRGGTIYKLQK